MTPRKDERRGKHQRKMRNKNTGESRKTMDFKKKFPTLSETSTRGRK
jgi:hypothetical protein